jgi:putative aminopeptidase FrvX
MHTPGEIADMKDVEGCIEVIAEFLCSFTEP